MDTTDWNLSKLIVGLILVLAAALLLLFGDGNIATAGVVAFAVLGLISIATARKK